MSFMRTPDRQVEALCRRYGIDRDEIRCLFEADMNCACEFQSFFVLLLRERLAILSCGQIQKEKTYAGYPRRQPLPTSGLCKNILLPKFNR